MNDIHWQTEQFERHRAHLEAVAYRMLGSVSEAQDALQESWLRLSRSQQDTIHNVRGWLTTIVGRVCVDMLRARQSRREDYVGASVPESIVDVDARSDPEQEVLMADTVGLALLAVLEMLSPSERVAYVLHDMFALPFSEVGAIIDRTPEAARQLASRARRRVRGAQPHPGSDLARQREVVEAFLAASRAGDFDALVAVLDPDVVFRAGPSRAAQQELAGAPDVAGKWAAFGPRLATLCHLAVVRGQAGLFIKTPEGAAGAAAFNISAGRITLVDLMLDLDGLERLLDHAANTLAQDPPPRDQADSASPPPDAAHSSEASAAARILSEALSWSGVYRATGHLGSVELRVGQHELGHLHGDVAADVPLSPPLHDPLPDVGAALEHQPRPTSGWVTVPLESEEGVRHALVLLRGNYEHAQSESA